jgi:plasmid maintenance system antidote protein VapI
MTFQLEKYKGIHPGIILERLLAKKKMPQRPFALLLGEHPQTINAITKGRRNLNTALALKIENELGLEEGALVFLQAYYDIAEEKNKKLHSANLPILRKILFWDTDMSKIDWEKQYKAIIQRVYERGSEIEKKELEKFYGITKIETALHVAKRKPYTIYKNKQKV